MNFFSQEIYSDGEGGQKLGKFTVFHQNRIDGYTLRKINPLISIGFGFDAYIEASNKIVMFTAIRSEQMKTKVFPTYPVLDVHT